MSLEVVPLNGRIERECCICRRANAASEMSSDRTVDPMQEMWFGFGFSLSCLGLGIAIGLFLGGML